jgi:hypothetical protein
MAVCPALPVAASALGDLPGRALRFAVLLVFGGSIGGCDGNLEPVVAQVVTLRAVPERLDFGDVPLLARAEDAVVVVNNGNAAWNTTVGPRVEGPGMTWVGGCDAPLPPGGTCTARVRFAPPAEGPQRGILTFAAADDDIDAVVVELVGRGVAATVVLAPPLLDFGNVLVGRSATLTARIENPGPTPLAVPLTTVGSFLIDGSPGERVYDVPAAGRVDVAVVFAPTTGGESRGTLRALTCGPACGPATDLWGTSTAPRIDVQPRLLELGSVGAGSATEGRLVVGNLGDASLVLEAVDVEGDASFTLATSPEMLPWTLAPGETREVVVRFAPDQGLALAQTVVTFRSTDPLSPAAFVPVTASSPGAGLQVLPARGHLGFLDPDEERDLSVVARATGDTGVTIVDVRVVGGSGAFLLVEPPEGVGLRAGESVQFHVRARALPGAVAGGGATARIVVATAEVGERGIEVAFAAGTTGCVPRPVIAHVALGAVRIGEQSAGDAVIENIGDAPCALAGIDAGDVHGFTMSSAMSFNARGLQTLAPGATGVVRFAFAPRSDAPASATAVVTFADVAAPVLVSASGRGIRGGLVAVPTTVSLGPVAQGCADVQGTTLLVADGAVGIVVEALSVEPPAGPMTAQIPALPAVLLPGESLPVALRGDAGADVGVHEATLRASSDSGTATVRVTLTVVEPSLPVEERFIAADVDAVDILFVVDNSGSMLDDQELLAANFSSFFAAALADRGIDFQLGVTTTDVLSPDAAAGRLVGPVLDRRTPDLEEAFATQVRVGADGSGMELGLEALRLALEDPDAQGLIRDEAALSVVFVTDEEDTGAFPEVLPDPALAREPAEYVALLQAKKGGAVANAPVLVSAVITPGFADRYGQLVDRFGGTTLDITSPDWGSRLGEIGVDTFTLSRAFVLAGDAVPDSVVVEVDGRQTADFVYDEQRHTVVVDRPPRAGAEVVVRYVAECR